MEEIAYLAGVIDGEGSITINKASKGLLRPRIDICSTSKEFLEYLLGIMRKHGIDTGYFLQERKVPKNHKRAYHLIWDTQKNVLKILEKIYPYLFLKRRQAKIVIDFCKSRLSNGRKRFGKKYSEYELKLYYEIKELNRRGKR